MTDTKFIQDSTREVVTQTEDTDSRREREAGAARRRRRRLITSPQGSLAGSEENNTSTSGSSPINTYMVANKSGSLGEVGLNDVEDVHTGPATGTGIGNKDNASTPAMGFTSDNGSKVLINNTSGGETIEFHHHTGAQVIIDADGSIHLMPKSKKGFGLVSDTGNGTIYAKGDLVLKGDSKVFVETPGVFEVNAGQMHLNVRGDMVTHVGGSMQTVVDGTFGQEVVKDYNQVIGGQRRTTVAGNSREQIAGNTRYDIGQQLDMRVAQQAQISTEKALNMFSGTQTNINSKEEFTLSGSQEVILQSQKSVNVIANENVDIEGKDGIYSRSNSRYVVSSKGSVNIDADSSITTRSSDIRIDADSSYVVRSESAEIHADTNMDIRGTSVLLNSESDMVIQSASLRADATGEVDIRGGTIDLNKGAPNSPVSPTSYQPKETTVAKSASAPDDTNPPEFIEQEDIIDNMTTERQSPEDAKFPNGKRMSAEEFSYYEHQGGQVPNATKQAAYANQGAVPDSEYDDTDDLPDGVTIDPNLQTGNNSSEAKQTPYPTVPNLLNANAKLSRHITCGMFVGVFRSARGCGPTTPQVMANIQNLCYNILDPLWEKFGDRGLRITSGLRRTNSDNRGSKHFTGEAADVQLSDASNASLTAEVAAWVRDHLPHQAILLELTRRKNFIIHLESLQPGNRSTRGKSSFVATCGNTSCSIRKPGISGKQARRYQRGRG